MLPEVRVGEPTRHETLSVFPLFAATDGPVERLLSEEGIGSGAVTVEEVSEAGAVATTTWPAYNRYVCPRLKMSNHLAASKAKSVMQ